MTFIKYVLLIVLGFSGFNSFARGGDEVRNGGGYIIRCDTITDGSRLYFFADYYFGYHYAGMFEHTYLPPLFGSAKERVALVLHNLAKVSPEKAKVLNSYLESFEAESVFVTNMAEKVTTDVPLNGGPSVKTTCFGQQLIVQSGEGQNVRYTIHLQLWNVLPVDQKAFAILHEILLRDYRTRFNTEEAGWRVQKDCWTIAFWSMNNKPASYLIKNAADLWM